MSVSPPRVKKSFSKRLKDRLRPRWVKTLRRLISSRVKLEQMRREFGLKPISGNPMKALKKSNTLFILGSGDSINSLSEEEWREIDAADSIGFNFWPIHDYVPDLYVTEVYSIPPGEEHVDETYRDLMQVRAKEYAKTPILIKDGERVPKKRLRQYFNDLPDNLRANVTLSWDWEIPDEDESGVSDTLRRWDALGMVTGAFAPLLRKRASVFYLVVLGLRAGYQNIVLCGVDLNNNDYFYRTREAEYAARGIPVPQPVVSSANVTHKTDNPTYGQMTISKALSVLDRDILKPRGIHLSVAFRSSGLHPMLPSYFGR